MEGKPRLAPFKGLADTGVLACTKGRFYSPIQAILTVERRIDSQMRFQIILAFEIIGAHSPVFVQDEVIYWLEPGKSGGRLQKARTCCRVNRSPCQGNFGRFQNCYETLISIQAERSLKRLEEVGHTASVDSGRFWQGASTPKADGVLEECSHKQSSHRQLQRCAETHSSFPRSKPVLETQSGGTECPFWNVRHDRRDWNWSQNLATCSQWLPRYDFHRLGSL